MPQSNTQSTFSSQQTVVGPAVSSGGVKHHFINFSFGTNSTYDVTSPYTNVLRATAEGAPMQTLDGTNNDRIVLANSINASGFYTLIADANSVLNILRFSRGGTNGQDVAALIIGKG